MNPQDQKVPDQHSGPDAEAVAWLNSYNVPEGALKPKRSRKWLWIAVICFLFIIVGTVVFALLGKKTSSTPVYSTQDLVGVTQDGITFSYPKQWQKISAGAQGFSIGYGASNSAATSSAAVYYKKSQIYKTAVSLKDINDTARQEVQNDIKKSVQEKNTSVNGCNNFKLLNDVSFANQNGFGTDIEFTCKNNARIVHELDRYLYVGDGNLYQVSVAALDTEWQINANTFASIIKGVTVKK